MLNTKWSRSLVAPLMLALALGVSAAPLAASAQEQLGGVLSSGLNKAAPAALKGATDPNAIIANLISAVIGFLGVVLFLYLLYGGFLWMTAGGDMGQVKTATSVIRNAIIGLVIITLAYSISYFIITNLGNAVAQSGTGQPTPASGP